MGRWKRIETRLAVYSLVFLFLYLCLFSFYRKDERSGIHRLESPYGVDYGVYYAAATMARSGQIDQIYDIPAHHAMLEKTLNRELPFFLAWMYPPMFLLPLIPLSLTPFSVSLSLWLILSFAFAFFAVRKLLPQKKLLAVLICGFPGVWLNLRWGQNAFLNTALLALGLAYLNENPPLSGVMFGLLVYKPQMAFFPLVLLLFSKRWNVLLWAGLTAIGTIILSCMLLGTEVWIRFFQSFFGSASSLIDANWKALADIQPSLLMAVRLLGGSKAMGLVLSGVLGVLMLLAGWWVWKNTNRLTLMGAILILGTLLVQPYFLLYDQMILVIPLVLLTYDYLEFGCERWEWILLFALWLIPAACWGVVLWTHVQICPLFLTASVVAILLRVKKSNRTLDLQREPAPEHPLVS